MKKPFPIRAFITTMLLIVSLLDTQAQQTKISGKITNESKEALSGANILVKDRVSGTTSNNKGKFYLEVKGGPPVFLSVSMIGYKSREIKVGESKINLEIILVESITTLDEILVQSPSRVEENILQSPVSIEKYCSVTPMGLFRWMLKASN
ncbi:MAG: hypothetical protein B6I19_09045 [Bacteroidetes bacterium 4572_114]|nr:MAG: hypothetical protein B6I19_09045 [Bacteroidetes bacterium 4572_114]